MRPIELQAWQCAIVLGNPGHFARGLFHSDGYRGINRVRAHLADGDRWYEYPRYLFTKISVARREAVARLDEFVGPKY